MNVINEDFRSNKLMFFKAAGYSENTKKSYWRMYLNYISDLEIEGNKDLYDFSQDDIDIYKEKIKDKSNQTILQMNAFINKYVIWYSKHYNQPTKTFNLKFSKEVDNSWYISKKDFFKMCDNMIDNNVLMNNIIPLLLARYGIVGKEACYIRNLKREDINFKNKEISIYNNNRTKVISKIPVDDKFIEFIEIIDISEQLCNGKKVKSKHLIRMQSKEDEVINYQTLNSKVFLCFKTIKTKRISFTTLFNCAVIDHINKIYSKNVPRSNDEFIKSLLLYYPEEALGTLKVATIKKLYGEVTGDALTLNTRGRARRSNPLENLTKEYVIHKSESINSKYSKLIRTNEIIIDGNIAYIIIEQIYNTEKVKINTESIEKIKGYKWYLNINGFVVARMKSGERLVVVYLSNFILNKAEYYRMNYLNGDKLDCTFKNLEVGDLY